MNSKKGQMGIGMLLIFVATIVASTIAAGVLITATSLLQERALSVEEISRERLISGIDVVSVFISGNRTAGTITELEIMVRLRAGSRAVELSTLGVMFISRDQTYDFIMNETLSGPLCRFSNLEPQTEFCVDKRYSITDDDTILEDADLAYIRFRLSDEEPIEPEQPFQIILQPKVGSHVAMDLRAPDLILTSKIRLR